MNILYTCDNNYVWLMGISSISLLENNKHIEELNIYLLGENISDENKTHLEAIAQKYGREIIVMDVPKLDIPSSLVSARWPLSAFTRLYAGELLPECVEKVLYLDCDTIVTDKISELENIKLGDKAVAGVKDCVGKLYKENIGLLSNDVYINAGVLLMNLVKLRTMNIPALIERYMEAFSSRINYADQDVLNGIFKGAIQVLNPSYNVMTIDVVHTYEEILRLRRPTCFYTKAEISEAIANPIIVHYTTNMLVVRPWYDNSDHPLRDEFKNYKKISPWEERQSSVMMFTAKEAKVIRAINYLPKNIAIFLLGVIHAKVKPLYIRFGAK